MNINELLLAVGVIIFIIYAVFNIIYLIDLRKTSFAMRQFIAKTETNLDPALSELRRTLGDIRKVTDDVSTLIERLRAAVGTVAAVEKSIRTIYSYYKEGFGQAAQANVAGLKAGVKAGIVNLVKNLKDKKKEGSL